ncbi:MAG: hypothetical protein HYV27_22935 [Candidatus Hydrogenedentes bacterium]|nr:hypothetical protein [Candidatus Hydrogenedentota bacterium]
MSLDQDTTPAPLRPVTDPKRTRRSAGVLGLVIFLCGVLVGGGASVIAFDLMMTYRFRHPERAYLQIVKELEGALHLTPEQVAAVTAVFKSRNMALQEMFVKEVRPRLDAQFDALRDEVATILNPEQAEQWKAEFEKVRHKFRPPPPPEMGGPHGP